jgi:ribosomal protein L32
MTLLIPIEKLRASQEKYYRELAEEAAAPAPTPSFVYRERTRAEWERRATQTLRSSFGVPPTPIPTVEAEESEDNSDGEFPTSKVSSTTPCIDCGHARKDHHTTPAAHVVDGEYAYYCISAHCDVGVYKDGQIAPCSCLHFRARETDKPKLTRPRVGDYDLCASCGHFKISHCSKKKPGAASRLKPGELAYRILQKPDGGAYPCKHFSLTDPACQCMSTSCSHTSDGVNFCSCEAFQNPWLVKKSRSTTRNKATAGATAAPLGSAETSGTPESVLADSPARPRRIRN